MFQCVSKMFWPQNIVPKNAKLNPKEAISKSQKLMTETGLIKSLGNGLFHLTPIAQRSVDKCIDHIHGHMKHISSQKITLPSLTPTSLWKTSGRLMTDGIDEIFILQNDKNSKDNQILLSPTHEESITQLLAQSYPISYKQLPIKLYQIGSKFRNEMRPRFGLIRAKEFLMKDLYTFDESLAKAENTYGAVNQQYELLFNSLEIPWIKVEGETGTIGGSLSHEYHIISNIGDDIILHCLDCRSAINKNLCADEICLKCKSKNISKSSGIEIGHTFLLGQKYSKPLNAKFLNSKGKTDYFFMGCYGIGVSRLVSAALEVHSSENQLKWPTLLAPYDVCFIPPKEGSAEDKIFRNLRNDILLKIAEICEVDNLLLDDRTDLTIGRRLLDSKRMGYPLIVVAGSKIKDEVPLFELHYKGLNELQDPQNLFKKISDYVKMKRNLKIL